MTQNKQINPLWNLCTPKKNGLLDKLVEHTISSENQQAYEKAYFEAVDDGTSQLRVKLNE